MANSVYRPSISLLRASWWIVALLCMVLKPMVGMAGEMHRTMHDEGSHHEGVVTSMGTHTTLDDASDDEQPTGWHVLLHADLCCGNAAILTYSVLSNAATIFTTPTGLIAHSATPDLLADLFRPPILG